MFSFKSITGVTAGLQSYLDAIKYCTNGQLEKLSALISKDSALAVATNEQGSTLLHVACFSGHVDIILALLLRGASIDQQDESGYSPLMVAIQFKHIVCVEILIARGASILNCNHRGHTPLHIACIFNSQDCLQFLLTAGAPVNALDAEGRTPLMCAIPRGHVTIIEHLLKCTDISIFIVDIYGHDTVSLMKLYGVQTDHLGVTDSVRDVSPQQQIFDLSLHRPVPKSEISSTRNDRSVLMEQGKDTIKPSASLAEQENDTNKSMMSPFSENLSEPRVQNLSGGTEHAYKQAQKVSFLTTFDGTRSQPIEDLKPSNTTQSELVACDLQVLESSEITAREDIRAVFDALDLHLPKGSEIMIPKLLPRADESLTRGRDVYDDDTPIPEISHKQALLTPPNSRYSGKTAHLTQRQSWIAHELAKRVQLHRQVTGQYDISEAEVLAYYSSAAQSLQALTVPTSNMGYDGNDEEALEGGQESDPFHDQDKASVVSSLTAGSVTSSIYDLKRRARLRREERAAKLAREKALQSNEATQFLTPTELALREAAAVSNQLEQHEQHNTRGTHQLPQRSRFAPVSTSDLASTAWCGLDFSSGMFGMMSQKREPRNDQSFAPKPDPIGRANGATAISVPGSGTMQPPGQWISANGDSDKSRAKPKRPISVRHETEISQQPTDSQSLLSSLFCFTKF